MSASSPILGSLRYFNHPLMKEGIKNVIGCITFVGGIAALYQLSQASTRKVEDPSWWTTADKAMTFVLKASIVLSCLASRPGLFLYGWVFHYIATPKTWMEIFGLNTIFEFNWTHPRHLLNIAANALSAAALIKGVFDKYVPSHQALGLMVAVGAFNFFTGRSTLHLANDAWHFALNVKRA